MKIFNTYVITISLMKSNFFEVKKQNKKQKEKEKQKSRTPGTCRRQGHKKKEKKN